jgi:hypothetical protein
VILRGLLGIFTNAWTSAVIGKRSEYLNHASMAVKEKKNPFLTGRLDYKSSEKKKKKKKKNSTRTQKNHTTKNYSRGVNWLDLEKMEGQH